MTPTVVVLNILVAVAFGMGAAGAWNWKKNSCERQIADINKTHTDEKATQLTILNKEIIAVNVRKRELEKNLIELESRKYQELKNAIQNNDIYPVNTNSTRMPNEANSKLSSDRMLSSFATSSMVDGTDVTEFHQKIKSDLTSIAAEADKCAIKLEYFQQREHILNLSE